MAAVTADTMSVTRAIDQIVEDIFPITTSNTLYVGALANFVTTTGRVASATAAASRAFAGEVVEILDDSGTVVSAGTGNAGGTVKARIQWGHEMLLNIKTATRTFTNLGKTVFLYDNVTVGGTSAATAAARIPVGQLASFLSLSDKTMGWVKLRDGGSALITGG